jgi:N6-L-threonylcarbamoyladenine synthase
VLDLQPDPNNPNKRIPRLLFDKKITSDNVRYGGIHPLRSLESHHVNLATLVQDALHTLKIRAPDLVAVTKGPGMRNNLQCGIDTAKGLAIAWKVPLVGVHHMHAHALSMRLHTALAGNPTPPTFPFLSLLVSGGHTLLVHSKSLTEHQIVAETVDIAIGDCLDKIARLLLPTQVTASAKTVSYGSLLEAFAFGLESYRMKGDYYSAVNYENVPSGGENKGLEYGWRISPPYLRKGEHKLKYNEFSFAGLASQVERIVKYGATHDTPRSNALPLDEARALARVSMEVAFEHLASRVCWHINSLNDPNPDLDFDFTGSMIMEDTNVDKPTISRLVMGGGVAANLYLKHILTTKLDASTNRKVELRGLPQKLCVDNAAMIAWAAAEMVGVTTAPEGFELDPKQFKNELSMRALRKWSLENLMTPEVEEAREVEEEKARDARHAANDTNGRRNNTNGAAVGKVTGNSKPEETLEVGTHNIDVETRLRTIEQALENMGLALHSLNSPLQRPAPSYAAGKLDQIAEPTHVSNQDSTTREQRRRIARERKMAKFASKYEVAIPEPQPSEVTTTSPKIVAERADVRRAILEEYISARSVGSSLTNISLDLGSGEYSARIPVDAKTQLSSSTSLKQLLSNLQDYSSLEKQIDSIK